MADYVIVPKFVGGSPTREYMISHGIKVFTDGSRSMYLLCNRDNVLAFKSLTAQSRAIYVFSVNPYTIWALDTQYSNYSTESPGQDVYKLYTTNNGYVAFGSMDYAINTTTFGYPEVFAQGAKYLGGHQVETQVTNGNINVPVQYSWTMPNVRIVITVTPDTGYKLSSLAVYKTASQDPVDYTKVNDTTYRFVMPDANVTVTGIFVKVYTVTGTASPNSTGSITVTSPHGENENVSFTVVPNEGYYVDSVRVYGLNNSREFEWNEETLQGSFSMPPRNVDVVAYLSNRLDPNEQGGTSQPAGGGGSFNIASDLIPVPAMIGNGILQDTVSKGLITAYNPSAATVADVGNWLYATDWGDALYQGFRDLFVKPIDSLISLMILPVVPHSSINGKITFGPHNTNLSAPVIDQQYVDKDLGYLEIKEYWGSYLDYNPFTKIQLFLPFIGSVDLDTDLVMGKVIKIKYRIDILTGACVAFLATYENNSESVFSEFTGHCGMQIPISATDSSSIASALMTTSALVLTKGASAIASDQSAALKVTQATNRSQLATYAVAKGNVSKEAIKERHDAAKALEEAKAFEKGVNSKNAQALEYPVTYTVGHVMGSKVTSTISGSVSGGPGLMGSNKPFLIIRRPRQSLADEYKHYVGYPCNMTCKLGTLSGFTRVEQVWLENVPCTDEEIADIITSLKEGVVI